MLPFQFQSALNFASHAIIHQSQQSTAFCAFQAIILHPSLADPFSVRPGSARTDPPPVGA
ncbi:hypothetical protein CRX67_27870 (plasmid) [Enterobacteriaceae bacterium A-F18]|nr:hypothetical protein CRX67_27870 [Enterobacteriaceae bacterium A-F18]